LNLSQNDLTEDSLSEEFFELHNLSELDISHNRFKKVNQPVLHGNQWNGTRTTPPSTSTSKPFHREHLASILSSSALRAYPEDFPYLLLTVVCMHFQLPPCMCMFLELRRLNISGNEFEGGPVAQKELIAKIFPLPPSHPNWLQGYHPPLPLS